MKKIFVVIFLLLNTLPLFVYGQFLEKRRQYITISGATGYSNFTHSTADMNTQGFLGSSLNIGYEYKTSSPFYIGLGAEVCLLTGNTHIDDFADARTLQDDDPLPGYNIYEFRAYFNSIKEKDRALYVNIPVLFGCQFYRLYFNVGAKVGIPITAWEKTNFIQTTAGKYPWAPTEFRDMPTHGFISNLACSSSQHLTMGLNVAGTAEVGMNVLSDRQKNKLRVGLFAEYGLFDINTNAGNIPLVNYTNSLTTFDFSSYMESTGTTVHSLYCGLKLTYAFNISHFKKPCRCN